MPDDIVYQLKNAASNVDLAPLEESAELFWHAAKEIERLREALDEYKHRLHWANEELLKRGRP